MQPSCSNQFFTSFEALGTKFQTSSSKIPNIFLTEKSKNQFRLPLSTFFYFWPRTLAMHLSPVFWLLHPEDPGETNYFLLPCASTGDLIMHSCKWLMPICCYTGCHRNWDIISKTGITRKLLPAVGLKVLFSPLIPGMGKEKVTGEKLSQNSSPKWIWRYVCRGP